MWCCWKGVPILKLYLNDFRDDVARQTWWQDDFLEGGSGALVSGRSGPTSREQQLKADVTDPTQALNEAGDPGATAQALMDNVARLGPLQQYLDDPAVEEIGINSPT